MPPKRRPFVPAVPAAQPAPESTEDWLRSIVATVMIDPRDTTHDSTVAQAAAVLMLNALEARDTIGVMLAASAVAAYKAAMSCFRSAAEPDLPVALACRLRSQGASAARVTRALVERLDARRASHPGATVPGAASQGRAEAAPRLPAPRRRAA